MAVPKPQSQPWPEDRALLLVHGVGNARSGSYDDLVAQIRTILGAGADRWAIYVLLYDQVNEWLSTKVKAASQIATLAATIRDSLDATKLGSVAADFAGDVIWPLLVSEERAAVRTTVLQQLRQIVADGERRGHVPSEQHISIMAHSMGCFHAFEALHTAASDPSQGLTPTADNVRFDNVVFVASPLQLIRDIGRSIRDLIPQRDMLRSLAGDTLRMPSRRVLGRDVFSARSTKAITGNLDPVGGFFVRRPYAFMDLDRFDWSASGGDSPTHETFVDEQGPLNIDVTSRDELTALLEKSLRKLEPPDIAPDNPHSWSGYVERHATELRRWLA